MGASGPGKVGEDLDITVTGAVGGSLAIVALTKHQGEFADIPVVVMTAMDLSEADRERIEDRVEQVLGKGGYSRDELLGIVRDKVGAHAKRRSAGPPPRSTS